MKSNGYFLTAKIQVNNTFNSGELNAVFVALPPLAEQQVIKNHLDSAEAAIRQSRLELHKLGDIKTALMQDLLTGRKRVTPLLELELAQ
ncbi:restriction endonuclease subunit S [Pseudacidobacterium ailaaui]|jgi:type I restriction enzyme S subunit|uniref:restriction endonuclease subunit S n=1 Tax=Pseudacidobacterium ailaaui TaxID=1382359 RepID=UPI00047923EB|nr:restriction endonuclease subunit S [Pseudacidobacterium ailaaui]